MMIARELTALISSRDLLVSRFRSSQDIAEPYDANFGIKGTLVPRPRALRDRRIQWRHQIICLN